jgi:hypothetical protein
LFNYENDEAHWIIGQLKVALKNVVWA